MACPIAQRGRKEAKDKLPVEREKQVRLEKRNNKKKRNKENANKSSSSTRNSDVLPNDADDTQDTTACMYCEIQYCQSTVPWVKCKVCEQWACSQCAHLGKKRMFVCDSCKQMQLQTLHLDITACFGLRPL